MYTRLFFVVLAGNLGFVSPAFANPFDFEKETVFSEDFTAPLNRDIWVIKENSSHGNEDQYYTADNIKTDGKGLHIIAERKKTIARWRAEKPYEYTSGAISTKQPFLFGRFEIVAKMPQGKGFWPALWLCLWEKNVKGEIDIMEGFGDHPDSLQSTVHRWNDNGHGGDQDCAIIGEFASKKYWCKNANDAFKGKTPDLTSDYHTYTLEWLPSSITFFLDGKAYQKFTGTEKVPMPNVPMQFIINFAMGDSWDGSPDETTPFPASMDVKSVKIWRMKNSPPVRAPL